MADDKHENKSLIEESMQAGDEARKRWEEVKKKTKKSQK